MMKIQGTYRDCFTDLRRTKIAVISWGGQFLPGFVIQNYCTYLFSLAGLNSDDAFSCSLIAAPFTYRSEEGRLESL